MRRNAIICLLILLTACAQMARQRGVIDPGANPRTMSLSVTSEIKFRPYTAEELATPNIQEMIKMCEEMRLSHCRETEEDIQSSTKFERRNTKGIFVSVYLGGVEPDRDYELDCRWINPKNIQVGQMKYRLHIPSKIPDNAFLKSHFYMMTPDPSKVEFGLWRVEVTVNGAMSMEQAFEILN
jgi:hypothetical protein